MNINNQGAGRQPMQMRFGGRGPRNFGTGEKPENTRETIKRLIRYFTGEYKIMTVLFLSILLIVICQVTAPRLQSIAIDCIKDREFARLPRLLITMCVIFAALSLFNFLQGYLSAILSQRVVRRMRGDLFRKIVRLPISYFDSHSHGDIMSRMTNDVDNVSNTLAQSLGSMFSGVLVILGTVIMMFSSCARLALLSCVVVLLTVFATKYLSRAMRKFFTRRQILLGELNGTVEEMVIGHKTVAAYCCEEAASAEFNQTSKNLARTGLYAEILSGSMGPVMNVINNIGFVIIAAFGGYFAYKGIITIGVISAFIIYAKQFSRPINEIAQLYGQLQTAFASAERVFIVMEMTEEDRGGSITLDKTEGVIEFNNLDFSYDRKNKVLTGFNLKIQNGQRVALVGATGSGKTTAVNLLMRFYDPDSGAITIDGTDIRLLSLDSLRRGTAIVLQDTVLFKDTVRNNLCYANPDAGEQEIIEAAKRCHCHSFIMQMKRGYDTVLSEGGDNLSRGQRQLLAICRALLAKPKILVLDEATSSVDTRTEKQIQDAMNELMQERTCLIIAHRLSTIQDADNIIVMDRGKIVESGSHTALLSRKGRYFELYMTQFAGQSV